MKWSFIAALFALALGVAAGPVQADKAQPEALYIRPIKYAEYEEDAMGAWKGGNISHSLQMSRVYSSG